MDLWHCRDNYDSDDAANNDEEKSDVIQERQKTIAEYDERAAGPSNQQKRNIYVPWLNYKVWVEHCVHLDGYIGRD